MYEAFFQFHARPFSAAPVADRYFAASAIEQARRNVTRCIERAEGPALVIGPAGSGKSLLCQVLAEQLRGQFDVALLGSVPLTSERELLQNILFELDLPYQRLEEGEMRLALMDQLKRGKKQSNGLLLVIDEAHNLPIRLLEEIRMITNLVRDGQPRVRLVLVGGPLLEEQFANPKLESFHQRVAARCYLQPLNREETQGYIAAQIQAVGGQASAIFMPSAVQAVYRATDGIPRLVNQICDHALLLASRVGARRLEAKQIEEAWADLQQLPTPWEDVPVAVADGGGGGIVEFGELRDEEPDARTAAECTTLDAALEGALAEALEEAVQPEEQTVLRPKRDAANLQAPGGAIELQADPEEEHEAIEVEAALSLPHEVTTRPETRLGEIELVYHGVQDPFGEVFDDEEIVVDRYAALDAQMLNQLVPPMEAGQEQMLVAALKSVASQSGRVQLSVVAPSDLAPAEPADAEPEPADAEPADAEPADPLQAGAQRRDAAPPLGEPASASLIHQPGIAACDELSESEHGVAERTEQRIEMSHDYSVEQAQAAETDEHPVLSCIGAEPHRAEAASDRGGSNMESRIARDGALRVNLPDDRDMIIIEDEEASDVVEHGGHPTGRARRQEYRQLFARLRRS